MTFEYKPVTGQIQSVELIDEQISTSNHEHTGLSADLTKEQRRKKSLVQYMEDSFESFEQTFSNLLQVKKRPWLLDVEGIPGDTVKCANCEQCVESVSGEPICKASKTREEDGETLYKVIPDDDEVAAFCPTDHQQFRYPKDRVGELPEQFYENLAVGYDQYIAERKEKYDGRNWSGDLDDYLKTEAEYVASELRLGSLMNQSNRTTALLIAWKKHLEHKLQNEFDVQRAEAYLRIMESEYKRKPPGAGGDEFEHDIRQFIKELDWPLYDNTFKIETPRGSKKKEMDIHTELPSGRAIIEVYTYRGGRDKTQQLKDYIRLYEQSCHTSPVAFFITKDRFNTITEELLNELLDACYSDSIILETERRWSVIGRPSPVAGWFTDFDSIPIEEKYLPPESVIERETKLAHELRSYGFAPKMAYCDSENDLMLSGPTIELSGPDIAITFYYGEDWCECRDDNRSIRRGRDLRDWLVDNDIYDTAHAVQVTDDSLPSLNCDLFSALLAA